MKYTILILSVILLCNCGQKMEQEQSNASQDTVATTKVDQNTRRRIMKTGVTAYDPELTYPGYVLYCPSFLEGKVRLMDLKGETVQQWEMPSIPGLWGYLLPNGNLFYIGKSEEDLSGEIGKFWKNERGGWMVEVDWNNEIVWEHIDHYQHHNARRTESGGAIYLTLEKIPEEVVKKIQGGRAGSEGEHGRFGR